MPPKTIKKAIKNCLENLREKDFKKFCDALIADAGIATSRVEGKDFLDVTNVVVTNFGEAKALDMVIDLLEDNGCKEQADALVAETKELTSKAGSSKFAETKELTSKAGSSKFAETKELTSKAGSSKSAGASTGTDRVTPKADGEHFVDRYREDLIQRVKTIPQILDQLLTKKVIDQETYDKIRVMRPPQEQMREIYKSLNARACKDIFYEILEEKEKWLIDDLKKNE